jgi:haloacetate dehalogenase
LSLRVAIVASGATDWRNGIVGRKYDVLAVWRERATQVSGKALQSGHWLTEEVPNETLAEVMKFLSA